jgi:Lipocalin-like domain
MRPGRSPFQSQDWHHGTAEEYVESGSGYIAYCGSYVVNEAEETVTHTPSVSLLPNLIHASQLRSVALNGDRLTLRVETSRLEWQRLSHPIGG